MLTSLHPCCRAVSPLGQHKGWLSAWQRHMAQLRARHLLREQPVEAGSVEPCPCGKVLCSSSCCLVSCSVLDGCRDERRCSCGRQC